MMATSDASGAGEPDWQPTLRGRLVVLRPLVESDFAAMYEAASDPLIWAQHPERDRCERPVFERYFRSGLESGGALLVLDAGCGAVIGSSRFYEWDASERSVLVGYTFLVRSRWGTGTNAEMKRLMLDHAFRWARIVRLHVHAANMRSRTAVERLGARLEPAGQAGQAPNRLVYSLSREAWFSGR